MKLKNLQYFITVAQEKNISKAAKKLNTTQPNLSKQLKNLEEELEHTLLIRSKRSITLTQEGMILYKRAKEIVDLAERTENEILNYGENTSGDIYIGAIETNAIRYIGKLIVDIRKNNPNIKIHIHSESVKQIQEGLDKGLYDFGLILDDVELNKYDYIQLPLQDSWGLLMNKKSPLSNLDYIRPKDLENLDIMFSEQQVSTSILSGWFGKDIENLNIIGTFNLVNNTAMMIEEGLGYLISFSKLTNTIGTNLVFKEFQPSFKTNLYVIWKKNQVFNKPQQLFLNKLKKKCNMTTK